jgi:hypothetical protein
MQNNTKIIRDGNCGVGCFFSMGDAPARYGISNNHIVANLNDCQVGDPIRSNELGLPMGSLSHWVPLKGRNEADKINYFDIGLFKLEPGIELSWQIEDRSLARPLGFIEPRAEGNVYMMTHEGCCKKGKITKSYINHVMEFEFCGKPFLFTKLMEIVPLEGNSFSIPGNAGSIILSSSHYIVGLLLGTNSDATKSYAVPFVDGILKYLPLTIL